VAEILATRSFSEFAVVGEAGRRVLALDGSRPRGVRCAQFEAQDKDSRQIPLLSIIAVGGIFLLL
jgi:hypothetical protein